MVSAEFPLPVFGLLINKDLDMFEYKAVSIV